MESRRRHPEVATAAVSPHAIVSAYAVERVERRQRPVPGGARNLLPAVLDAATGRAGVRTVLVRKVPGHLRGGATAADPAVRHLPGRAVPAIRALSGAADDGGAQRPLQPLCALQHHASAGAGHCHHPAAAAGEHLPDAVAAVGRRGDAQQRHLLRGARLRVVRLCVLRARCAARRHSHRERCGQLADDVLRSSQAPCTRSSVSLCVAGAPRTIENGGTRRPCHHEDVRVGGGGVKCVCTGRYGLKQIDWATVDFPARREMTSPLIYFRYAARKAAQASGRAVAAANRFAGGTATRSAADRHGASAGAPSSSAVRAAGNSSKAQAPKAASGSPRHVGAAVVKMPPRHPRPMQPNGAPLRSRLDDREAEFIMS
eukprot:ctg_2833.g461